MITLDAINSLLILADRSLEWPKVGITLGKRSWDEAHCIAHTGPGGGSPTVLSDWLTEHGCRLSLHPTHRGESITIEPLS